MENIAIIYGGESVERDISIITAMQVLNNIDTYRYNPIALYMLDGELYKVDFAKSTKINTYTNKSKKYMQKCTLVKGGILYIKNNKLKNFCDIDCVVVCCHGGSGENGELQGWLELNDLAYTCANVKASSICMDKSTTHKFLSRIAIKNAKFKLIDVAEEINYEELYLSIGNEIIVKPNSLGSSVGVGVARDIDELKECIVTASLYDNKILVEEKINNLLEFNCAGLMTSTGLVISDIDCPVTTNDILSFNDKYIDGGKYINLSKKDISDIPIELIAKIQRITERAYKELDLFGVVRIDYLYDYETNKLYLNEINTIPGSLAYYLFDSQGYSMQEIIGEMIVMAKQRKNSQRRLIKQFNSSVLNQDTKNISKLLQK